MLSSGASFDRILVENISSLLFFCAQKIFSILLLLSYFYGKKILELNEIEVVVASERAGVLKINTIR